MTQDDAAVKQDVSRFLARLNRTWVIGDPKDLAPFFHEAAVIVAPGWQERAVGREACVERYVDFRDQATIDSFEEGQVEVDLVGDIAVASYTVDIAFTMDGRSHQEQGRDVFVLRRDGERWLVLWRTLLPSPPDDRSRGGAMTV